MLKNRNLEMDYVLDLRKQELVDSVMLKHNPLARIEIGCSSEVLEVRKLAREIVTPLELSSALRETIIEVIATVMLHCMYAHYADSEHYPYATLTTVSNLFKCSVFAEEVYDEDGKNCREIYYSKPFKDVMKYLSNFQHVPSEGIRIPKFYYGKMVLGKRRDFTAEMLHFWYPFDVSVYEMCPYVHPWIFRNFCLFAESESSLLKDAFVLAPVAIDGYLDSNPNYKDSHIDNAIYNASVESSTFNADNYSFNEADDEIKLEEMPVRKGKRLKSLREIVRQVFFK